MRKYEEPSINVDVLKIEDVIAVSGGTCTKCPPELTEEDEI